MCGKAFGKRLFLPAKYKWLEINDHDLKPKDKLLWHMMSDQTTCVRRRTPRSWPYLPHVSKQDALCLLRGVCFVPCHDQGVILDTGCRRRFQHRNGKRVSVPRMHTNMQGNCSTSLWVRWFAASRGSPCWMAPCQVVYSTPRWLTSSHPRQASSGIIKKKKKESSG